MSLRKALEILVEELQHETNMAVARHLLEAQMDIIRAMDRRSGVPPEQTEARLEECVRKGMQLN